MKKLKKFNDNDDFVIAKIKENFSFEMIKELLDKEVIEWTPEEEESTYYSENSNGEAEDAVITYMINWYTTKYQSIINEIDIKELIQKEYNFLNY